MRRICESAGARVALSRHWLYGGDGVTYTPEAQAKLKRLEADPEMKQMTTCMVKPHLSLSHDPKLKDAPKGWTLPVRDILTCKDAGFVVPVSRGYHIDARYSLLSSLPPH